MQDLSPEFETLPAELEVVTPPNVQDVPSQSVGGAEATTSYQQSPGFESGVRGWRLTARGVLEAVDVILSGAITAVSGAIGGFTIGADYIRDVANTFGFASTVTGSDDVRFWAGDTFANRGTAPARITEAGAAVFKSIQIGGATLQYQVGDGGIFTFGDGSDSTATFADQGTAPTGTTKTDNTAGATIYRLDRDVYYTTMTINATVTLNPNGYRIFCSTSATINGTISRNGNAGTAGTSGAGAAGGAGGAALADGYLKGSVVGGDGGAAGTATNNGSAGSNGTATSNSLALSNGKDGGHGGATDGVPVGGVGGTGGTSTASSVKLIANWHLATLLDVGATGATVKFTSAASSAGGGGGGRNGSGSPGSGGGGGSAGGVLAIYAKTITVGAAGIVRSNGGIGGNGGDAVTVSQGVGGGGSGGNGGIVILVYNSYTNSGSVTAGGGTKGTKGTGGGNTTGATDGSDGAAGTVYQFLLSL